MVFAPFKKVKLEDDPSNRFQENVADSFFPLLKNPLLDGQFITASLIPHVVNHVPHNLGRDLLGWIVADRDALGVDIARNDKDQSNRLLNLVTTANITITLYVF